MAELYAKPPYSCISIWACTAVEAKSRDLVDKSDVARAERSAKNNARDPVSRVKGSVTEECLPSECPPSTTPMPSQPRSAAPPLPTREAAA